MCCSFLLCMRRMLVVMVFVYNMVRKAFCANGGLHHATTAYTTTSIQSDTLPGRTIDRSDRLDHRPIVLLPFFPRSRCPFYRDHRDRSYLVDHYSRHHVSALQKRI